MSAYHRAASVIRARADRAARALAGIAAVVVVFGGLPGARLRPGEASSVTLGEPALRDGRVVVTVRDGAQGPPIAGVVVRAFSFSDDRAQPAGDGHTDARGVAALSQLPRGDTWILADAPGRARASAHLVVDAAPRAVTLDLVAEHAFDVLVRDEGSAPIAGAVVEATAPGAPLPVGARSDDGGRAHVGRLGPGPWSVAVRAPGYDESDASVSADGETATVVLRRLACVAVHVSDGKGRPVSGARVMVAGASLWPPRSWETDANGDAQVAGLAAGVYAFRATRGDLVSPIELGVPVARGEDRSLALTTAPGRWVAVRVTDGDTEEAAGVARARVTLAEGGLSPFPVEATTDAAGRARLGPIAPGMVTVSARADGFVSRGLVSLADAPASEARVVLLRAGAVTGRVVDDEGYPVAGATIEIVGTQADGTPILDDPRRASFQAAQFDAMLGGPMPLVAAGELGVTSGPVPGIPLAAPFAEGLDRIRPGGAPWRTASDGTFRAAPASPGRVRAIARHAQYVEAQSDTVTLAPGGEASVEIVLHRGGALEGRVVDADDRPVAGVRVSVAAVRGALDRATRTASDGTFAFAALPDHVVLTAAAPDDGEEDVRLAVAVPEDGRQDLTVRLPAARGALAVTVVDPREGPIEEAQVSAVSLSPDVPLRVTSFTDTGGEASLRRARGLPLRLEVSAPGHATRALTVDPSADDVHVELAPAETVTGDVVAADGGDAVAGAEVTVSGGGAPRRALTDARGHYSIDGLAPGRAVLRVRAHGFAPASAVVAVPDSGGARPFEAPAVELAAEGVVEGDVVDASGRPVVGARVARGHVSTWVVAGVEEEGAALTDADGHFSLGELPEGTTALEAYAPDVGRARVEGVRVRAGSTTSGLRFVLAGGGQEESAPAAPGGVAVTLGETSAPVQVVVVSVEPGSEAERAGLLPGDVVVSVDGAPVSSMTQARDALSGPLSDDVVVRVRRGARETAFRLAREPVRR